MKLSKFNLAYSKKEQIFPIKRVTFSYRLPPLVALLWALNKSTVFVGCEREDAVVNLRSYNCNSLCWDFVSFFSSCFFHQAFNCPAPCYFLDVSELTGVDYFIINVSLSENRQVRSLGGRQEMGTDYRELQKGMDTTFLFFWSSL